MTSTDGPPPEPETTRHEILTTPSRVASKLAQGYEVLEPNVQLGYGLQYVRMRLKKPKETPQ